MVPNIASYLVPSFIQRRYTAKFVILILLVVVAIGAVGYVGYAEVNGTLSDTSEENIRTSAGTQADLFAEWTTDTEAKTRYVSQQQGISHGNQSEVDELIDTAQTDLGGVSAVHVADFESDTVLATTSAPNLEPGTQLSTLQDPWGGATNLEEEVSGNRLWISNSTYISSYLFANDIMTFAVATNNESRALVLSGTTDALVSQFGLDDADQKTAIVNASGGAAIAEAGFPTETLDSESTQESVQTTLADGELQFDDGGSSLQAYAPVDGSGPAADWVAVSTVEKNSAYAVRDSVGQNVLLIVAVAFLTLGIMGLVLGRQTVTPLRRLRTKAQSMEAGDLEVDLDTRRKDEIGQLYAAFDSMRESLREQIEEAQSAREEAEAERERIQRINTELEATADEYSDVMQRAADGDLTARMEASTENEAMADIAAEYNAMLGEIEATIEELNAFAAEVATASEQVTASSEEVRSASEQISDSVQEISAGAERQNESLQSVNQEMSDLSTTTEEIAASSNEVADIAERTADTGKDGRDAAQAAIASMREIEDESSRAVEEIGQLEQEVGQIDELIERIQEISDQTNMLALNANIEASRSTSGEGDGGFGVVAQEVKELSQDAKDAAEEIEDRLESIREQTRRSADEVEQTSEDVDEASEQVANAVEALEEIAEYAGETNTGVQEISAATEEQAASTQEVVAMVDEAATISEETTTESESVAAATEEQTTALTEVSNSASDLSEQAARLSEALDRFDTDAELEGGAETRMLEGDEVEEDLPDGDELDDGAQAADVEEDIDAFQPGVEAEEFGADAAAEPEGGADEPAASPAAEPDALDLGDESVDTESAESQGDADGFGAEDGSPDPDDATDVDAGEDAVDATSEDVFDFGNDAGSDAVEGLGDQEAADAGDEAFDDEPADAGGDADAAAADAADRALTAVSGIGEAKAEALREAGYESVGDLRAATQAQLAQVAGIADALAVEIKEDVGHE